MIFLLLTLIDIHTLFVLFFHEYLSFIYVLSGSTLAISKGLIFFITGKDLFSILDIISGLIMLFLLIGNLWTPIFWIIAAYFSYKIIFGLSIFIKI